MPAHGKSKFYVSNEKDEKEDVLPMELVTLEPNLLHGELIISKAKKALRLPIYDSKPGEVGKNAQVGKAVQVGNAGQIGYLYCTNFRICFVTAGDVNSEIENGRHKFIGADDILLSNISDVYQISSDKRKRLTPGKLTASPKRIQIYTKDIGIHCFGLELSDKRERNNLMTAILHYAFPKRHDLLFTYIFSQSKSVEANGHGEHAGSADNNINLVSKWKPCQYTARHDLEKELVRLDAKSNWRVTEINHKFEKSATMPQYFAVPCDIPDGSLGSAVEQFSGGRLPMWCYTHSNNYSLVSMPTLSIDISQASIAQSGGLQCNRLLKGIREAQPCVKDGSTKDVLVVDLNKQITNFPDIQNSFTKMCSLCTPESVEDFYSSDNSYYSQLESASWLRFVTSSLHTSTDIAQRLEDGGGSVVIREDTSRDVTCIVSSLVQIMLDSSCRTIKGFQSMIMRCWVSAGHPFCDRLAILHTAEDNISPVFLLFLDCVYQLIVQFPSSFEFSEIYLITLWDSCVTGLFKEFIFNCNQERVGSAKPLSTDDSSSKSSAAGMVSPPPSAGMVSPPPSAGMVSPPPSAGMVSPPPSAGMVSPPPSAGMVSPPPSAGMVSLLSVWDWELQYNTDYISLFRNPLYELSVVQQPVDAQQHPCRKILSPNCHASQIEVWIGCFYRNTVPMQILNGGKPAEYFQQCIIMEEIIGLQNKVAKMKSGSLRRSGLYFNATQSTESGMLAKLKASFITSTFPFNNVISRNVSDISLCTLLERSLVLSDRVNDEDDDV